jgi:hypothetical protein
MHHLAHEAEERWVRAQVAQVAVDLDLVHVLKPAAQAFRRKASDSAIRPMIELEHAKS